MLSPPNPLSECFTLYWCFSWFSVPNVPKRTARFWQWNHICRDWKKKTFVLISFLKTPTAPKCAILYISFLSCPVSCCGWILSTPSHPFPPVPGIGQRGTVQKDIPFALLIYSREENKWRTKQIMKADFLPHTKQPGTVTQPTCLNPKDTAFQWRSGIRLGKKNIQV